LGKDGIRVNSVSPAWIWSPEVAKAAVDGGKQKWYWDISLAFLDATKPSLHIYADGNDDIGDLFGGNFTCYDALVNAMK
jgi:NAD(P)-dependent dehydrogenase (short-subunit alcohol dehydrogenase family)